MVKLRLTNFITGQDILPIIWSDNYFTLTPANLEYVVWFEVFEEVKDLHLYIECHNCRE